MEDQVCQPYDLGCHAGHGVLEGGGWSKLHLVRVAGGAGMARVMEVLLYNRLVGCGGRRIAG